MDQYIRLWEQCQQVIFHFIGNIMRLN
ncbi:hypothetical protein D043_4359B, partial [Vibrio parahaemolyticus EKP-021]